MTISYARENRTELEEITVPAINPYTPLYVNDVCPKCNSKMGWFLGVGSCPKCGTIRPVKKLITKPVTKHMREQTANDKIIFKCASCGRSCQKPEGSERTQCRKCAGVKPRAKKERVPRPVKHYHQRGVKRYVCTLCQKTIEPGELHLYGGKHHRRHLNCVDGIIVPFSG